MTVRLIGLISIFLSVASLEAQTQAETNAAARADFKKADADLNKTYQAVLAKLPAAEKHKLKEAQRAWVASRDAEATRAAKEAEGGSMAPTIRYETMTQLTRERVKELEAMLDKAIEGGPKAAARSAPTSPALRTESAQHEPQTVPAESPINAQESVATFEKIRDVSPDGKFGVRISCSSEPADPENIDSNLITAVKLVYLPSKKVVMDLQNYDGSAAHVIWSQDSNWLAFSSSSGPAVTDTYIYRRAGDDFNEFKTDGLQVDVKGDIRNQYVRPIRWLKPGVLLLEQNAILRSGGESTIQFTGTFDEKTGKLRISSKEKQ